MMIAPAFFNRLTNSASSCAILLRSIGSPFVVFKPLTKKLSFIVIGTPNRTPNALPSVICKSFSLASLIISSFLRISLIAFTNGFICSIRSKKAVTVWITEISLLFIFKAISLTD